MLSFHRHLIATKGFGHAAERSLQVAYRFTFGGRRLDRLIDLIEQTFGARGLRLTVFVSAGTIRRHLHRIERLRDLGHDIGSHGMFHSRLDLLDREHQSRIVNESHKILTGAGFNVSGFRSPYLNYNSDTREALDLSPFRWTSGDVILWNNGLQQNAGVERLGELYHYYPWEQKLSLPNLGRRVVDIPISAPDDEILYERYRIHNRKTFRDACVSIFEQTYSSGELYNVLFHPERFRQLNAAIGDLVDHVQGRSPAVWCPTINELADWWQRRSAWHWQRIGDGRVRIEAPPEATVLIQGSASDSGESASQYIYRKYRAQPPAPTYPALTIGLSPRCPRPLEGFLHDEGFLVERAGSAQDHSIFLDRSEFRQTEARNLLDEIDGCKRPLLRLWRWPNGCRSAFCISADICAIDLKDFFERKRNFVNGQQRSSVQSQPLLQAVPQQSARSREPASLPAFASGRKEVVSGKVIWIDLDNTPHVPFFIPIIRELENRGCRIVLSARDAFQVCDLASQSGLQYTKIGRHYGKNMFLKVYGWVWRSMQLLPFALREKPDLALSHGARSQILLANVLRIPTVMIMDYEHSKNPPLCRPKWEIVPEVVMKDHLIGRNVLKYPGIKEDVYVPTFVPDSAVLTELGISEHDLVLTVRPPATEAHYHNPESEPLLFELMNWALTKSDARIVLLPRNEKQGSQLKEHNPTWFANGRVIIPKRALNGLNLLWHSDLVVSGGGTMNREAAALGVPVYSIFRGPIGAVDRYLQAEGRLVLISSVAEIRSKIKFRRRSKDSIPDSRPRQALHQIIDHVQAILLSGCEGGRQ